jgi:hypothetical protein
MKLIGLIGALGLGAATAAGVAACGSSNASSGRLPTVTITAPAPAPTGQQPSPAATTPATTTTPSVTTPARATRTAPAPAFTRTTGGTSATGGDAAAAAAAVMRRGYTPVTQTYDPSQTLRVLIGSSGGRQQAFFFDGSTYLGTDTKLPSRSIAVVGQSDTEVTLRYATSTGPATVHFALDMGKLAPLDPIPSVAARG